MIEDVEEKLAESLDLEQYWAPVSRCGWHIILIPLFLGWLIVWMAATFLLGNLWMVREMMQRIFSAVARLTSGRGRRYRQDAEKHFVRFIRRCQ
jgi:hypothetical protein